MTCDPPRHTAGAELTAQQQAKETRAEWFRVTAAYGALYGLLYAASGHQVLAPTCAHAGINFGLCMRDWRRMQATPLDVLEATFAEDP